ncbi:helix-turn-helix domain-containing protein [Echinicola jeungdonensis]|uniref:Helix-turn-helix domain-containing protein n=1 Tax=Echinicola jeungdonensis TaxID=709343 RepID=A0ABV5J8Q1_9BACT|nr:helix-turn-helix domain-containing protein [Echinicola jeungdonensis]MDN3669180.1 helix-turn-helix domain-containing protein [Echinicola jeungdonensis]
MPLFMAYHHIPLGSINEVKKTYLSALPFHQQLEISYHQFWFNEEGRGFFCLIEGPDKSTCNLAHELTFGEVPIDLTQVEAGNFAPKSTQKFTDFFPNDKETDSLGFRGVLVISIRPITPDPIFSNKSHNLEVPPWARAIITEKLREFRGREIGQTQEESIIGVFHDVKSAYHCARSLQQILIHNRNFSPKVIFKMGLSASSPFGEKTNSLSAIIQQAQMLSHVAKDYQVIISPRAGKVNTEELFFNGNGVKCLAPSDEKFLTNVLNCTELHLSNQKFTIPHLCQITGISRPQLYRKITAITGRSPSLFFRDLRLEKAFDLLKQKSDNVTQIALEVGFNNPSYFAKCFTAKYGCKPSAIHHHS